MLNKTVLYSDSRILNLDSGFKHKFLCTGPTFTAGTACAYKCTYCYVEAQVGSKPFVTDVLNGRAFKDVVIRRNNAVAKLRTELKSARGVPKYKGVSGVIYGSPLVDIAATKELTDETIGMVQLLLDLTGWDIRLLSKSPLVINIAKSLSGLQKKRVIFGLSTGTLNDAHARATEPTCPSPTRRTEALRWLQDNDFRTFAMLCPIAPQPMSQFIEKVITDIRPERCEHVWAEVINLRGDSMTATAEALQKAGLMDAATELQAVCGPDSKAAWEQYARGTFEALANTIPMNGKQPRLRFLQYVSKATEEWWTGQISNGAVVLGGDGNKIQTATAASPTLATTTTMIPDNIGKDPKRVAAAKKAWATIRANQAAKSATPSNLPPASERTPPRPQKPLAEYTNDELMAELGRRLTKG